MDLKKYNIKVKNYRTNFIEDAATLEVQLEWLLSAYFARSSRDYALFNQLFFSDESRLGFYDKITMFERLVSNFSNLEPSRKEIIKKLNRIRKMRNKFAHSEASFPHPKILEKHKNDVIFSISENGELKEVVYSFDYLDEVSGDFKYLNQLLADKIRELKDRYMI
jgi:hypothetical protein